VKGPFRAAGGAGAEALFAYVCKIIWLCVHVSNLCLELCMSELWTCMLCCSVYMQGTPFLMSAHEEFFFGPEAS
jgi:hypothetical protein